MNIKAEVAIPFARPVYIRSVLNCLNSLGIPPSRVLAHAGLAWQDVCDGQRMVDFSVFRRLVAHAIQCSGEPALGLISGSMLQPLRHASQACQRLESELRHGAFVQRVRHALLEQLTTNPDIGELASDLGISSRKLVRRLAEAGVTFSNLKDELRRSQAAWYLQHTELSIEAVASQLGYADHANFSRKGLSHLARSHPIPVFELAQRLILGGGLPARMLR